MNHFKLSYYYPIGMNIGPFLLIYGLLLGMSWGNYRDFCLNILTIQSFYPDYNFSVPSFEQLWLGSYVDFYCSITLIWSMVLLVLCYRYHFQGSNAHYLMKRLPNFWEYPRRVCFLGIFLGGITLFLWYLFQKLGYSYYWTHLGSYV